MQIQLWPKWNNIEIPDDWGYRKLEDVIEFIRGSSYTSKEINSEGKGSFFVNLKHSRMG